MGLCGRPTAGQVWDAQCVLSHAELTAAPSWLPVYRRQTLRSCGGLTTANSVCGAGWCCAPEDPYQTPVAEDPLF